MWTRGCRSSLLTALSGFSFDLPNKTLGFEPRLRAEDWRGLWAAGSGWGTYSQRLGALSGEISLSLAYGELGLETLVLGSVNKLAQVVASVDGRNVKVRAVLEEGKLQVSFEPELSLGRGETLRIALLW